MADTIIRDGIPIIETRLGADFSHLDAIYHQKYGKDDGFRPRGTRYWVHAVFDASQPHGDHYAAISQWLGHEHGAPFVPYIIEVADDSQDMRRELNIPADAIVFGRFGGRNSFDIPCAWEAIADSLKRWENVYFLFANTDLKMHHKRIIDLPTLYEPGQKRKFINSCNAMLHARERGETFGIAVGEFAICGKPVLTYAQSRERAHIEMLRHPMLYHDLTQLKRCMEMVMSKDFSPEDGGAYRDCTPEKVMKVFEQVFIE